MKRSRLVAGPLLAALALFAGAPASRAASPPVDTSKLDLPVEKTKLANGLEVILHEDHRTPIVSVNLWYHVGSKDEPAHKNGFAHLFEHVMFQGSKHVPEDTYFRYLERAGATSINGSTSDDRTNYYETVPANRLELALWLESDRMGFLLDHADQHTFETQREVVKNERRQNYENAPYGLVRQWINEAVYPAGHPYHFLTIGTPEDLDNASLDDVKAFFRTWYVPNNATLVVAGDIDKKKTLELVEKYFGPIPSRKLPARSEPGEVEIAGGDTKLEVEAGVPLPRVYIAWPTPKVFTQADGDLDLVAHVLASGKTSRLYKRLVYDKQIAQQVSANQASGLLGSTFMIIATATPGHTADELLAEIDDELAKLRAGSVSADELGRAKTDIVSSMIFGLETNSARADMINYYNQSAGDPSYVKKDVARYENATADGIKATFAKYAPATGRVVAVVTPNKEAPVCGRLVRASKGKAQ